MCQVLTAHTAPNYVKIPGEEYGFIPSGFGLLCLTLRDTPYQSCRWSVEVFFSQTAGCGLHQCWISFRLLEHAGHSWNMKAPKTLWMMQKIRATSWSNVWSSKCCDFLVENALWMCGEAWRSHPLILTRDEQSAIRKSSPAMPHGFCKSATLQFYTLRNGRRGRYRAWWGSQWSPAVGWVLRLQRWVVAQPGFTSVYNILYTSPTFWPMFDHDDVAEYSCWILLVECWTILFFLETL